MIRIENLTKTYEDNVSPLNNVSLQINDGEVVCIIGPSGTGKSTLIRCINQLEKATSGKIYYNDIEITAKNCKITEIRKHIGMVFQSFNLFPHLTVLENIMNPQIDLLKISKQQAMNKSIELLKQVGLYDKINNYPAELSGGQKQRAAIARTLGMDCDVILFDEPTSALDPSTIDEVQSVIKSLAQSGKTLIIVTHDLSFARMIAHRVIFLNNGGIAEDGPADQIFENAKNNDTRRFIKKLKTLEFHIDNPFVDIRNTFSEIKKFCIKHSITTEQTNKLISVFEEIVVENLLDKFKLISKINVSIEYNNIINRISFRCDYNGEQYNILEDNESTSAKILSLFEEQSYRFDEETKTNVLKFKF